MADESKIARAGNALKAQGQQDIPATPADLAVAGSQAPNREPDGQPANPPARRPPN